MSNETRTKYLFIHGAGGTKSKWRNFEPYFSDYEYEVIDLPGHGSSDEPLVNTIEEHADIISKMIDEDTIVVGHSMGGLIAIELAARNSHVKGVIFVSSFYELPVHPKMLASFDEGVFPDALFHASYSKDADAELIEKEKQEKDAVDMKVVSTDFHACNSYKAGKSTLEKLNIPILSIYGTEDRLLPNDSGAKLQAVNERIKVHAIEGGKHYLMLETPELASEVVQQFYKEVHIHKS